MYEKWDFQCNTVTIYIFKVQKIGRVVSYEMYSPVAHILNTNVFDKLRQSELRIWCQTGQLICW